MPVAFITGATGFLGRHLVEQLRDKNWTIIALVRKDANTDHLNEPRIETVIGDILDRDSLKSGLPDGVDVVFHAAASTAQWRPMNRLQHTVNVIGTRNMVHTALEKSCGRFVHTSSIATYGVHHGHITEETPSTALKRGSGYMKSKYLAEQEVEAGIRDGLDAVFINPPHIMGRYDRRNWASLIRMVAEDKLPGIPPGKGSFSHAPAVARAHLNAFERGRTGERYLLGGTEATFLELIGEAGRLMNVEVGSRTTPAFLLQVVGRVSDWVSRLTRREPDLTPEKVQLVTESLTCSGEKARAELDYQPVSITVMLADTIRWMRAEGMLPENQAGSVRQFR